MRKATEVEIEAMAIAAAEHYAGRGTRLVDKEVMKQELKLVADLREKSVPQSGLALAKRTFERRLLELATAQALIRRPHSIKKPWAKYHHRNAAQSGGNHGNY
jgi:hypothetical protein